MAGLPFPWGIDSEKEIEVIWDSPKPNREDTIGRLELGVSFLLFFICWQQSALGVGSRPSHVSGRGTRNPAPSSACKRLKGPEDPTIAGLTMAIENVELLSEITSYIVTPPISTLWSRQASLARSCFTPLFVIFICRLTYSRSRCSAARPCFKAFCCLNLTP